MAAAPRANETGPSSAHHSSLVVHHVPVRARWLDQLTGTWLNPDPIFDDLQNTYRFVGNDPVNHTDPTGSQRQLPGRGMPWCAG